MDPTLKNNKRVDVVPLFYAEAAERLICVPWKMLYGGQDVVFTKFGMRNPTVQGKRMIHVFEMSDGANDYRLEFDAERLIWTLVSMIAGHYAS